MSQVFDIYHKKVGRFGQVVNSFSLIRLIYFRFIEFKLIIKSTITKVFVNEYRVNEGKCKELFLIPIYLVSRV